VSPTVPARRRGDARLGRDLRLFHAYRFLSTSYLFLPVMMKFFHERGLDYTQIALLNTVYAVTAVVFEVPTGALADLFGRCRAMMLGALLMALGCVVNYHGHDFWTFALGESLLALGMTLTSGADSAYLYDLLRSARRESEYRRHEGSATAAKMIGAAMALAVGGFIGRRDPGLTYAFTAGVCGAAALVAFMMREPAFSRDDESAFFRGIVHAGKRVLQSRPLGFAVLFSVLLFSLLRPGIFLHPSYLENAGFSALHGYPGLVMAGISLIGAVGAYRISTVRRFFGEGRLVWVLPLVLAATYFGLGAVVTMGGVVLLILQSLVNGVFSPFSKELINREVSDSGKRATVLSVESMARRLVFGAFFPVCGVLMDRYQLSAGFWVCGFAAALVAGGFVVAGWMRRRSGLHDFEGEQTPTPLPDAMPVDRRASLPQSSPQSPS